MKIIKKIFKINLFISSYIPLYIIIFIQNMDMLNLQSIYKVYKINPIFWNTLLVLSIISIIALFIFFNGNHTKKVTFLEIKSIDNDILDYFITYIIPLNTIDITKGNSILVNFIIFFIIGTYYIHSNLMHLNILLIFLGYNVFKDSNDNVIISKKNIDYFKMNENIVCKKIGNSKIYIVK